MTLFDSMARTERRFMRLTESQFEYYNTSARPFVAAMRGILEEWYSAYPNGDAKNELRQRFRKRNNKDYGGAVFELFMHALLRAMGYEVDIHPTVPGGKGRHPDFRVIKANRAVFYLEATVAQPSQRMASRERALAELKEEVNKIPSPDFVLDIEIEEASGRKPSCRVLRRQILKWLSTLDPDKPERAENSIVTDRGPVLRWKPMGWSVSFFARPRAREQRGRPGAHTIGIVSSPVARLDNEERIAKAVVKKAKKYGVPDLPLVVAVNVLVGFRDLDIMNGLFGNERFAIMEGPEGLRAKLVGRDPDGAWFGVTGLRNSRVSAVLLCDQMSPGDVHRRRTVLVHHPCAKLEMAQELWSLPQLVPHPKEPRLIPIGGKSAGEVLGIQEPWPPTSE